MKQQNILTRIWKHDHTVWKTDPSDILNRLGWLHSPQLMVKQVTEINGFVEDIRKDGFAHVLLLGMGGSSLAPEVFVKIFGVQPGYPELSVLDSTHPDVVLEYSRNLNLKKTLFITSTKSGGTVETLSFLKYFYNLAVGEMGMAAAGGHFAAITDAGSGLEVLAKDLKFRKIFLNDPDIGGRYSALSYFGLVPAALIGVDLIKLLDRAHVMVCDNGGCGCETRTRESALALGAFIAQSAKRGRDKLTFINSEKIEPFGSWIEQLVAESTGKEGRGILPVVGEDLLAPENYSDDRVFVHTKLADDKLKDAAVNALHESGFPAAEINLTDIYDLGGEFFRWEMVTAIAGHLLHIHPFNQPNVESAKKVAREMVDAYKESGKLPHLMPALTTESVDVYSDDVADNPEEMLLHFLDKATAAKNEQKGRSYVAIQAFIQPNTAVEQALHKLRTRIQKKYRIATTVGYGPRFLHSTGQLHKGDAGNGLFIQITGDAQDDIGIPDAAGELHSGITFGILVSAQAMGDRQALQQATPKRNTIRYHFKRNIGESIKELADIIH